MTLVSKVNTGDWVYFRRNQDRYWKGPAKVVLKDRKSLHCIMQGNPLIINSDDVLLNKPSIVPEFEEENFTFLPTNRQPPASTTSGQLLQPEPEVETEQPNGARVAIPLVSQSDNNQQLANSDILHETPDLLLSTQQQIVPAAHRHDDQRKPERVMQDDNKRNHTG